MIAIRAALAGALFLTVLGTAPQVATTTDPYSIFAKARSHWEHQRYPTRLDFTIATVVEEAGTQKVEHYAVYYDAANNVITTDCVSDYERAHPPTGRGVMIGLPFMGGHAGDPPIDFLGVPELAPNYSFGISRFVPGRNVTTQEIVAEVRARFHDPAPTPKPTPTPTPAPPGMQQIAVVTAADRHYVISLVGIEPIDGAPAYHLKLLPLAQPKRYRLRDLWIDTQTYATRQLISDGNFAQGPWPTATWTVRFAQIDGATYIAGETSTQAFSYRSLRYTATEVDVQDVHVPTEAEALPYCVPPAWDILSEPAV